MELNQCLPAISNAASYGNYIAQAQLRLKQARNRCFSGARRKFTAEELISLFLAKSKRGCSCGEDKDGAVLARAGRTTKSRGECFCDKTIQDLTCLVESSANQVKKQAKRAGTETQNCAPFSSQAQKVPCTIFVKFMSERVRERMFWSQGFPLRHRTLSRVDRVMPQTSTAFVTAGLLNCTVGCA